VSTLERTEIIQRGPAEAVAALFDIDVPDLDSAGVPLLWHWAYLLDRPRQRDLGPDGHPREGIPSPPGPDRRRMFAGGSVRRHALLRVGQEATRRTRVVSTAQKQGRAGALTFTTIEHEIVQGGRVVVLDRQDIVYLDAVPSASTPASGASVEDPSPSWPIPTDAVFLFRFSAITYNAHRIHYDEQYARETEGHPALVVHGPLQALAMAVACTRDADPSGPDEFTYRLLAPLYCGQGLHVRSQSQPDGSRTGSVTDGSGRTTASSTWRAQPDPPR
jgi:3-methylfumaryl-CoA hydratase